jgi:glutathione synthase/RimK-type ligase-like ATP-grasp enzyme
MANDKLLILYGYDGIFAHSIIKPGFSGTMEPKLLKELFESRGYQVELSTFAGLDLNRDFRDCHVLYASSEGRGLFYKEYIEDVLLAVELAGGKLLPDFKYFRAHHNKSFAEMLRNRFRREELRTISSRSFGSCLELDRQAMSSFPFPCFVKASAGSGSYGVKLVKDPDELARTARKLNRIIYFDFWFNVLRANPLSVSLINLAKSWTGRQVQPYAPLYANKFVVQSRIKDLDGDYKVLVFHDKFYVLRRQNRVNGVTASGSGRSHFPTEVSAIKEVLDFARLAHRELNTPVSSLDIARNGDGCHLLEFQCLFFGPYTLQRSPCHYRHEREGWIKVPEASVLETEYCRAVDLFIRSSAERSKATLRPLPSKVKAGLSAGAAD